MTCHIYHKLNSSREQNTTTTWHTTARRLITLSKQNHPPSTPTTKHHTPPLRPKQATLADPAPTPGRTGAGRGAGHMAEGPPGDPDAAGILPAREQTRLGAWPWKGVVGAVGWDKVDVYGKHEIGGD